MKKIIFAALIISGGMQYAGKLEASADVKYRKELTKPSHIDQAVEELIELAADIKDLKMWANWLSLYQIYLMQEKVNHALELLHKNGENLAVYNAPKMPAIYPQVEYLHYMIGVQVYGLIPHNEHDTYKKIQYKLEELSNSNNAIEGYLIERLIQDALGKRKQSKK